MPWPGSAGEWFKFGFRVIPLEGKQTVYRWPRWLDNLSEGTVTAHWQAHPEHGVGAITTEELYLLDADSTQSLATLHAVEAATGIYSNLPIQTPQGRHHWYRREPGTHARMAGFNSAKHPSKLDIRTSSGPGEIGNSMAVLPSPGSGRIVLACPAHISQLTVVDQNFLDLVQTFNGRPLVRPYDPSTRSQPACTTDTDEVAELLSYCDPEMDRDDWIKVGMALHHWSQGGDAGRERWHDWSAPGSTYDPDSLDAQYNGFTLREGGVTKSTLAHYAEQAGANLSAIAHKYRPQFDVSSAFTPDTGAVDKLFTRIEEEAGAPNAFTALAAAIAAVECLPATRAELAGALEYHTKQGGSTSWNKGMRNAIDALVAPIRSQQPPLQEGEQLALDKMVPVASWWPGHTKGARGTPKGTRENFDVLLAAYGISIDFDVISKETRFHGPGMPEAGTLAPDAAMARLVSLANLNEFPKGDVVQLAQGVALEHEVNPVRDWIESVPWDGRDWVGALIGAITLAPGEDQAAAELRIRKWLRGACAIGMGITHRMEYVLTFVDPDGGAGKTRFFASLCPEAWRKDSFTLDTRDKDSIKTGTSYWLVELGELDGTFSRSDQARLKSHLSSEIDELRRPYGASYMRYPRYTAYFASVNKSEFLIDASNNRRFWPVRVIKANHKHGLDLQQIWAQAAAEIAAGQQWHLTPDEEAIGAQRNDSFRERTRVVELLGVLLDTDAPPSELVTTTELLIRAGVSNPSQTDLNQAGSYMRRMGFEEGRTRRGTRGWMVPPRPAPGMVKTGTVLAFAPPAPGRETPSA
jgi:hypothetical protein